MINVCSFAKYTNFKLSSWPHPILNLLVNEQTGHTLTSADAHAGQEDLLLLSSALAETGDNLASTGGTQGMAQSDGTTTDVHLLVGDVQDVHAVDGHGGEGLVELDNVNVVNGELVLLEELGDGGGRANTHDARRDTGDGGTDELAEDGLTETLGHVTAHEQDGGGTVGDLGAVAASALVTKLGEGGADLGQTLVGGAPPRALILGQGDGLFLAGLGVLDGGGDGDDLVIEPVVLLGVLSTAVRLASVTILLLAGDVEVFADVLGGLTHGLHAVASQLVLEDLRVERAGKTVATVGHALGTEGETARDGAEGDLVGNVLDGLQAGGAEAVARGSAGGVGEAGGEGGGTDVVGSLGIGDLKKLVYFRRIECKGTYVAQADILDQRGVHVHPLDGLLQQLDDNAVDGGVLEAALEALGQRGTDGQGDDNIIGVLLGARGGEYAVRMTAMTILHT